MSFQQWLRGGWKRDVVWDPLARLVEDRDAVGQKWFFSQL
jgi:YD repeat-containing protein